MYYVRIGLIYTPRAKREYPYVREVAQVDGKPKVISQISIGSPEKVAGLIGGKEADILNLMVKEFGSLAGASISSQTDSEPAQRCRNKAGEHHLRQIGLGLLVALGSRLPLYYSVCLGKVHDSKHFAAVVDEVFGMVCGLNKTKERLTVVIDKGLNADTNYAFVDEHSRIHFITTYSAYLAQDLAATPLVALNLPIQ